MDLFFDSRNLSDLHTGIQKDFLTAWKRIVQRIRKRLLSGGNFFLKKTHSFLIFRKGLFDRTNLRYGLLIFFLCLFQKNIQLLNTAAKILYFLFQFLLRRNAGWKLFFQREKLFLLQDKLTMAAVSYTHLETIEYNTIQAKEEALQLLQEQEKIQLGEAEILKKDLSGSEERGSYVLKATYLCIMEIGKEQEILLER